MEPRETAQGGLPRAAEEPHRQEALPAEEADRVPPGVRLEKTGHQLFFGRGSLRRGGERAKTEEPATRVREARLVDGPPRRRLKGLEAGARRAGL